MTQQDLTTSTSPLTEAEPDSLDELMARDPMQLTEQNINVVVTALRKQRISWESEEASAKSKGKRPSAKAAREAAAKISLENLELDL